ncbi:MAG: hypothetical protein LIO51_06705 [Clostridiales bacterium]|nr:hypothetical protein [Clostridiales bacterium]
MKCLVCGKHFEGGECPRCGFPEIQFPGDPEEGRKKLRPAVDEYRRKLLDRVGQIGVIVCFWKDEDGVVVLDREERLPLGSGTELLGRTAWLPRKFARIPDAQELQLRVYMDGADGSREATVRLPNLLAPELQELGATVDEDMTLRLLLRSRTEGPVVSDRVSLLEQS